MVEILGNKLKVNSIDIVPASINHSNEYLAISEDESTYELINKSNIKDKLSVSYDKNNSINNVNQKNIDESLCCGLSFSSNQSQGFLITTNGIALNNDLDNLYKGLNNSSWVSKKANDIWVCLESPLPIALRSIIRSISDVYSDIINYEPKRIIIEASSDNSKYDIMKDETVTNYIPYEKKIYNFNEGNVKYKFWRIRFPISANQGSKFSFMLFELPNETAKRIDSYISKPNFIKLENIWVEPTIPYREGITDIDKIGTVTSSYNISVNGDSHIWKAFRGKINNMNDGWVSEDNQEMPVELIYTPTNYYDEGYYIFSYDKNQDNENFSFNNLEIIVQDIQRVNHIVSNKSTHLIKNETYSTDLIYIPYKFRQVSWKINNKQRANSRVSLSNCQIWKYNKDYKASATNSAYGYYINKNTFYETMQNNLHTNIIKFDVSEQNPLKATFSNQQYKEFNHINDYTVESNKKYCLITPIMMNNATNISGLYLTLNMNQDYISEVEGSCSGVGSEIDNNHQYWKAICSEQRATYDCWVSKANSIKGGPIYKWNKIKLKGNYVFKFISGWWGDSNGHTAKKVNVSVRKGDSSKWITVWSKDNIENTYGVYCWSPVINIPFDFDQVYFEVIENNGTPHATLVGCSVYKEIDKTKELTKTHDDNELKGLGFINEFYENQNLYLNKKGDVYSLNNKNYISFSKPMDSNENDIWYNNKSEPIEVKQLKNGKWEIFEDVFLGNINMSNGLIQSFYNASLNNNHTIRNVDCIWSSELQENNLSSKYDSGVSIKPNEISIIHHNLNLQDLTKYKAECYLKCINSDCGYNIGDYASKISLIIDNNEVFASPFLTKNTIGIWSSDINKGWKIAHKYSGQMVDITDCNNWKIIFKIKAL